MSTKLQRVNNTTGNIFLTERNRREVERFATMLRAWTLSCLFVGVHGHGSMVQPRPRNAVEKSIAPWNGTFSSNSNWDHREYALARDIHEGHVCSLFSTYLLLLGKDTS